MATVSNPASLLSVISAFGGPSNLRSYLRGGSYVLNAANSYPNIATSGTLTLSGFAGTINPLYQATPANFNYDVTRMNPLDSNAYMVVSSAGTYSSNSSGTWLLGPSAGDFEVMFLRTSGTTPAGSAVNTWLSCATTRTWYQLRTTVGTYAGNGTLTFRLAGTSSNLWSSAVVLSATVESNICPTCCFTPDTLITMADGSTRAIVAIMVGDFILTRTGSKEVTEVITRTNRVMYAITFTDGRVLNASEDHPLYVVDKGYAAVNPGVGGNYKDLGIPDQLYVGDFVLDSEGKENAIVSIELINYPETVYTFAESEFYANGMLVY